MEDFDKKFEKLKEQLVLQEWPNVYLFKFITSDDNVSEILPHFKDGEVSTKRSSKGKYISISVKMMVFSADQIIEKYRAVSHIKGLISL
ncbi:DUF493 domain-containing protein [Flavobacteriales bacterium]|jgi:putative lipoic acid-binding regulatory protein|nr:DUF493 domain-containing protein [Flavobacteriales bacterium]